MRLIFLFFLFFSWLFALNFESIDADFVQTLTSPQGDKIVYRGKFCAKKPDLALWKYIYPIEKLIYLNGKRILIVEPELEQAIYSKLENIPNINKILQKSKKIAKDTYEAKLHEQVYTLRLTNNKPSFISYKDKLENDVKIKFFKVKTDIFLDNSIFTFFIPRGYDVLRD